MSPAWARHPEVTGPGGEYYAGMCVTVSLPGAGVVTTTLSLPSHTPHMAQSGLAILTPSLSVISASHEAGDLVTSGLTCVSTRLCHKAGWCEPGVCVCCSEPEWQLAECW